MQPFEKLEHEFASFVGVDPSLVVVCSSGTTALHLALEALELSMDGKVLVPEFTMVACARAVVMAGLSPSFVDCGEDLLMDPELMRQHVNSNTVAVMPVHIYGRRCDVQTVVSYCHPNGVAIVEDCAEFHGAPLSGLADAYCYSFYQNKIVAGEEGGAVVFAVDGHAHLARCLRCQGFTDRHNFLHLPRGINGRLSNANAEVVLESLRNVADNLERRRCVEQWYDLMVTEEWHMPPREVPWVYDVRLPDDADVGDVVRLLNKRGIAARRPFRPMSEQKEFYSQHYPELEAFRQSLHVMYLPITPETTRADVERTVFCLETLVNS